MNKKETIAILTLLSAFYVEKKIDPETSVAAWSMILKDYDYEKAQRAVIEFVKNDVREYASFPAPGVIINEIRKAEQAKTSALSRTFNAMYERYDYDRLDDDCKMICPRDVYERGMKLPPEKLLEKRDDFLNYIRSEQAKLDAADTMQAEHDREAQNIITPEYRAEYRADLERRYVHLWKSQAETTR